MHFVMMQKSTFFEYEFLWLRVTSQGFLRVYDSELSDILMSSNQSRVSESF